MMNESGIPDWQEPQAYGDTSAWGVMRWRWEFYRRRDDLREFFDANAEATFRRHCGAYGAMPDGSGATFPDGTTGRVLRPDEPGFLADCCWEDVQRFGYSGIPNPCISDQPESAIFAVLDYPGCTTSLYLGEGEPWPAKPKLEVPVCAGQAAVIFDLTKPLPTQIEAAKEWLERAQTKKQGEVKPRRKRKEKWLEYLRVLDAREALEVEARSSWQKMADALYRAGILNRYTDPAGGYCAPPHTAARDKWQQADALRNNFGLCFTIPD